MPGCFQSGGGTAVPLTLTVAPKEFHSPLRGVCGMPSLLYAPNSPAQSIHAPIVRSSGDLIHVSSATGPLYFWAYAASGEPCVPSQTVPCATSLAITSPVLTSVSLQRSCVWRTNGKGCLNPASVLSLWAAILRSRASASANNGEPGNGRRRRSSGLSLERPHQKLSDIPTIVGNTMQSRNSCIVSSPTLSSCQQQASAPS